MQQQLKKVTELLPGFVVCLCIALIAKVAGSFFPVVGAATFAIFLGIVAGNTFLDRPVFEKGTKFSESRLLEYSIVLMGATLSLSDMIAVGFSGVGFILLQMTVTISAAYLIGRRLGFTRKFSLLMCAGNAVCGSSAIGSVAPVVGAESKDKGLSITIVNVTGTILMVALPVITSFLYGHETLHTSAMIGGTLQSIGQVVASAKFVNDEVVQIATLFKIIRIIFLVLVALAFSRVNTEEEGKFWQRPEAAEDRSKVKTGIPWFIIGFFLLSIIGSLQLIPGVVSEGAHFVSNQFEIIALAAIGMRVKFKTLVSEGPKAMLYGGLVGCCQVLCALGLLALLF
ncbi:YeiH family protein [Zongyangia hominis]|uniref:YeiH family protein n=1 Tax=Zongyangia hominis TaxID=2763677 RepID=UPI0021CC9D5E|nr:putative sulfate exporter family transporter [Zongyangia hominis]